MMPVGGAIDMSLCVKRSVRLRRDKNSLVRVAIKNEKRIRKLEGKMRWIM